MGDALRGTSLSSLHDLPRRTSGESVGFLHVRWAVAVREIAMRADWRRLAKFQLSQHEELRFSEDQ